MLREHAASVVLGGDGTDEQMEFVARFQHLTDLAIQRAKITDRGMANCTRLRTLGHVDLVGCRSITGEALRHLQHAEKLEWLRLDSTSVGDDGMAFIAKLPALRSLFARDTQIGNAGLAHIAGIARLEELNLTGTKVDDRGVGELAACGRLRSLWLPAGVTSAGLAQLSGLKELKALGVAAHGATPLAAFKKLESLDARIDALDDGRALADVTRLPNLQILRLTGNGITDQTLRSVAGLQRQSHITVRGGSISEAGVRALAPSLARGSTLHLEESPLGYDASARLHRELLVNSIPVSLHVGPKSDVGWPSHRAAAGRRGFGGERGQAIEKRPTERDTHGATLDE